MKVLASLVRSKGKRLLKYLRLQVSVLVDQLIVILGEDCNFRMEKIDFLLMASFFDLESILIILHLILQDNYFIVHDLNLLLVGSKQELTILTLADLRVSHQYFLKLIL